MAADPIDWQQPIQFDASGKPFVITQSGKRNYLPPAVAGQSGDPRAVAWAAAQGYSITRDASGNATGVNDSSVPTGGFARSRGEWNPQTGQYDQGLNMSGLGGAILGGATVAPMVLGAAGIGPLATASGGSASGASGAVGGTELGGWLPSQSMGASMSATPMYPTVAGASGAASGGSAALGGMMPAAAKTAGQGLVGGLLNNAPQLAGLVASLAGRGGGNSQNSAETQRIQQITEARMRRADPLHQMAVQLAASRMPINVQRPVPDVPLPEK